MAKKGKKPIPKSQREISKSQQEPYVNPETGETRGNPNGDGKILIEGNNYPLKMIILNHFL
jgi:hypothetical protein